MSSDYETQYLCEEDRLCLMAAMIFPGICNLYGKTQIDAQVLSSLSVAHAQRIIKEVEKNREDVDK
jgi:hypothetical protein